MRRLRQGVLEAAEALLDPLAKPPALLHGMQYIYVYINTHIYVYMYI